MAENRLCVQSLLRVWVQHGLDEILGLARNGSNERAFAETGYFLLGSLLVVLLDLNRGESLEHLVENAPQ